MAQKSVLIIDEAQLFRDYLAEKLEEFGVVVIKAVNGVDGQNKMIHHRPDLIIADYHLSQRDLTSILRYKISDPNVAEIPVVVISSKLSREKVLELSKYNVKKFFTKPLKIDQLWSVVTEVLEIKIEFDDTPCLLETNLNDDIVLVEVALGFNQEKIELLEFKITELLKIHNVELPKFLVMFSGIELREQDRPKLRKLFEILVNFTRGRVKWVKVLTQSKELENAIRSFWEFSEMTVSDSLEKTMDDLMDKSKFDELLQSNLESRMMRADTSAQAGSLELRFEQDKTFLDLSQRLTSEGNDLTFAVVDDDFIVQEIIKNTFSTTGGKVVAFDDGKTFLQNFPDDVDLIFLDLMMPNMNGFEVMDRLKKDGRQTPIIILSALSRKETVLKAMGYGIRNYITKPLKPDELMKKTFEAIGSHISS